MIDFRNYEAMTFDCYGTLIDWETGILSVLGELSDRHGLQVTDNELLELYARAETHVQRSYFRPYREVLRLVMTKVAAQLGLGADEFDEDAFAASLPLWKPFPDTVLSLRGLRDYYRLGIISNIDDDLFAHTARHLEVPFDWVVTAEQAGAYKPAHRTFRYAKDLMGVHPSRIIHVAQSRYHDIAPARTLDWTTVWANRRGERAGAGATCPDAAEPDLTVSGLEVLLDVIRHQVGAPNI